MSRLSARQQRIRRTLTGLRTGQLCIIIGDHYKVLTPASPAIGAICRIIKIDRMQPELNVKVQDIEHPGKQDWVSSIDMEPCPAHWDRQCI